MPIVYNLSASPEEMRKDLAKLGFKLLPKCPFCGYTFTTTDLAITVTYLLHDHHKDYPDVPASKVASFCLECGKIALHEG